jgi:hypothetical protein
MLVHFMDIWSILRPFDICLLYFVVLFSVFGILYQEKSGNPAEDSFSLAYVSLKFLANPTTAALTTANVALQKKVFYLKTHYLHRLFVVL